MKKLFFAIVFFTVYQSLSAQSLVSIPDTAFLSQLKIQFPSYFVGDLLDTNLAKVPIVGGISSLSIIGQNVQSIEGIQYLPSITNLLLQYTSITSLPDLNGAWMSIFLSFNPNLRKIGKLSDSLTNITIQGSRLFGDSTIQIPKNVTSLSLSTCQFSSLPILPPSLTYLDVSSNYLDTLGKLPNNLRTLYCMINNIRSMDSLPYSLENLLCYDNQLKSIPNFPFSLRYADISNNSITSLISLNSSLETLICTNNIFRCLPYLPDHLTNLQTDVACIPNIPRSFYTNSSLSINNLPPICNPTNNKENCSVFPVIQGLVYFDLNNNQIKDAGDVVAANKKITISPSNNFVFTDNSGNYKYSADTAGDFTISAETIPYFSTSSPVILPSLPLNSVSTANFFYTKLKSVKDISVTLNSYRTRARPGFNLLFSIQIENKGSLASIEELIFNIPSTLTISSITGISGYNGTFLNNQPLIIDTLQPGEIVTGQIFATLSPQAILGDTLIISAQVNPNDSQDIDLSNNVADLAYIISGSLDPNDKSATPYLDPQKVGQSQWINYSIHFQNTGTDTAFTVIVADSLPNNLIASSLEVLSTSHTCSISQKGQAAYFRFDNILLPDSTINHQSSSGFVNFRVQSKANLQLSESINNKASIYFDFNSPVVTNYAVTNFPQARITGITNNSFDNKLGIVYPNPVENGRFFLKNFQSEQANLFNFSGANVYSGKISSEGLYVGNLPAGIYLLQVGGQKQKLFIE